MYYVDEWVLHRMLYKLLGFIWIYTHGIYYGSCWYNKQDDLKRKYNILFKYLPFYIKACLKVVKISLLLIIAYENISIFLLISVKISLLRF